MKNVALLAVICLSLPAFSQTFFGPQQIISDTVNRSYDVFAADLDNDGDQDVIGCSFDNHSVFWWENLGSGSGSLTFGPTQLITDQAFECTSVSAADFDGDGLIDIASGSAMDDKVAWYRNLGAGSFSSQIVIATDANATRRIYVADMNGDTRPDILSANRIGNEVAYYPNLGGGSWGPKVVISTAAGQIQFVHAADIEGDGDMDAFSASPLDSKFAWYENLGGGSFGPQQIISSTASSALAIHAEDYDGDGDADVIGAQFGDNKIVYHENTGSGFLPAVILSDSAIAPRGVFGADLDGDGDLDPISASQLPDDESEVAWFENLGGGSFGPAQLIADDAIGSRFATARDLDADGDLEILVASLDDFKVSWYENLGDTTAVSCDASTPPSGLNSNVTASTVQLSWNPVAASVACQIAATRTVPPGPSPSVNLIGSEVSGSNVPITVLGAGTTWEWRVRCACSIPPDPIVATGFSAVNTFSTPSPRVEDSGLASGEVELWSTNGQMIGLFQRSELSRLDLETGVYLIRSSDGESEKILLGQR